MKVTFFQRKPRSNKNFSVENYFNSLRGALDPSINCKVSICKYESSGFFKRLYNCMEAVSRQGDINHVTGDVNYITYFLKKNKTILTVLDCSRLLYLKGLRLKVFKYLWFILPVKKCMYITTISQATKDDLLKHIQFDADKIFVVPVCISPLFARQPKPFNKSCPRILQLGTAPNKNLERLIEAIKNIPCELVIVGVLPEAVKALVKETGIQCISFSKSLSEQEIIAEYQKADIVTLISTIEGFGMPIIEANTVGRVVITSNITSMPEVAGNAAALVDPYSTESMRGGFLRIIHDDAYREQLISNGYQNCQRYSQESIAAQFTEIYQIICKN